MPYYHFKNQHATSVPSIKGPINGNMHVKRCRPQSVRWPQSTISLLCTICSLLCTICSLLCTICSLLCTGEEHSQRYDMNLPARLLVRQPAPTTTDQGPSLCTHGDLPGDSDAVGAYCQVGGRFMCQHRFAGLFRVRSTGACAGYSQTMFC